MAGSAHVLFGHPPLGARSLEGFEGDAKLLCKAAHERRRAHLARRDRSWGLSPGRGRRGLLRNGAVGSDHDQHRPHRNDRALLDEDLRDLPGGGRRDLDRRLVRLDLDERLILGDLVAHGDEPAGDLALGQPLAEIGQLELVGHGGGIYRGRPTQASAGAISTRRPPSTRQRETACSSPASSGATSRGT